jgi:hypothetical protein
MAKNVAGKTAPVTSNWGGENLLSNRLMGAEILVSFLFRVEKGFRFQVSGRRCQ